MRLWSLAPGDPLNLTLAADFRLSSPDYVNDQIWEIEYAGDPPAFSMRTTYGLRASLMRLFPRFSLGKRSITDPAAFAGPPRLRSFYPNYLAFDFSPFPDVEGKAEFWIPDSHSCAGRITLANRHSQPLKLLLELCGQLVPLEGKGLAPISVQSVNVLAGRSSDLAPVVFLTGGPQPGPGPYPSLALDLALAPGEARTLTWVQAALADQTASFNHARHTSARPWESELARIELTNLAQTVEIFTGDPDWDAAFAFSQKSAFGLFLGPNQFLPQPSFVLTRQPDYGFSPRGDGADYPSLWDGQSPVETGYIAGLLPGAPELAAGLLRNFLAIQVKPGQSENGKPAGGGIDWRPGLAGQRGRWLAAPLLADLAWRTYERSLDSNFLRETQAGLKAFVECWFDAAHDRDQDGFPEWDHPLQMGLEDNPVFTVWGPAGQGQALSTVESPSLAAMLNRELHALARIDMALGPATESENPEAHAAELARLSDACWDDAAAQYHYRDFLSHRSPVGKILGKQRGSGKWALAKTFKEPVRLLVRLNLDGQTTRKPVINLNGQNGETAQTECLERMDFQWGAGLAVATSRQLYTRLDVLEVSGLQSRDLLTVRIMDCSAEDISLFLPLWAGIPASQRARSLVDGSLRDQGRFWGKYGIPTCPITQAFADDQDPDPACQAVLLPWNTLVGEGLLTYGMQAEAVTLTTRLMNAVIQNLKKQHAFYQAYHARTAAGLGERNALQGLAPLELFLKTLGVEIQSANRVTLSGSNPFPWPVTVKYRSLTVTRQSDQTLVVFPDGQELTFNDPTDAVVTAG